MGWGVMGRGDPSPFLDFFFKNGVKWCKSKHIWKIFRYFSKHFVTFHEMKYKKRKCISKKYKLILIRYKDPESFVKFSFSLNFGKLCCWLSMIGNGRWNKSWRSWRWNWSLWSCTSMYNLSLGIGALVVKGGIDFYWPSPLTYVSTY